MLEHIPEKEVPNISRELARLVEKEGFGIHIFPTKRTLIEPHIGIFGAHWLTSGSKLQKNYIKTCYKLGFGYWRSKQKRGRFTTKSSEYWVNESCKTLNENCYFVSPKKWIRALENEGMIVENISYLIIYFFAKAPFKELILFIARLPQLKVAMNLLVEFKLGTILKTETKFFE